MYTENNNKLVLTNFIDEVWNNAFFDKIENYISEDFIDHSLPPSLPTNKDGMKHWIKATSKSFEHKTILEDIVSEGNSVCIRIKMLMKHIGIWRDIEPTEAEISAVGYRFYKLKDGKIIEHWALIDGNAIENQLKNASNGCKIKL